MNSITRYFENINKVLGKIEETQFKQMDAAADMAASTISAGGLIFTFGTGHSHMLAEEIFYRAGGLVPVYPILDEPLMLHAGAVKSTFMERIDNYAAVLLKNYPANPGDTIFIFSNSGRNAVTVEMGIAAKAKGMNVIAITNLNHSKSVESRHKSGKKLMDVADIVIDNCGVIGDACMEFEGIGMVGPTSTAAGAVIMQAIVCRTVEIMQAKGYKPEVFSSSNVDGGDEINSNYIKKYSRIIKPL